MMIIDFEKEKRLKNGSYTLSDCEGMTSEQIMKKTIGKDYERKEKGISRADCYREMAENPLFAALFSQK